VERKSLDWAGDLLVKVPFSPFEGFPRLSEKYSDKEKTPLVGAKGL
jgi:hypothetical protein